MPKLATKGIKALVGAVVLALVVGVAYFALFRASPTRTVSADFPEAVGIYPGTPVDILGVSVGSVTSTKPMGGFVRVTMTYDSAYKVPQKAFAVDVANSLVSDRYIQLGPAYRGGPALADHAHIPMSRTGSPAELDQIYGALDKLSVALGPKGANKGGKRNGPLSTLLKVSAANLGGNGTALGASITKLAAAARTLANGRQNLFGTVHNLANFNQALVSSDQQIRLFNHQLAQVTGDLASERTDLGLALHDLAGALDSVKQFVRQNAAKFHTSFRGLENLTNILIREKSSLTETLAVAPVALANVVHSYQPNIGVLATRGNMASLTDLKPTTVCAVLYNAVAVGTVGNVLGSYGKAVVNVCGAVLGKDPNKAIQEILGLTPEQLQKLAKKVRKLLGGGGGLPPIPGPGGIGGLVGAAGGS